MYRDKELLVIYQGKAQEEAVHSHGVLAHPGRTFRFGGCFFLFAVTKDLNV